MNPPIIPFLALSRMKGGLLSALASLALLTGGIQAAEIVVEQPAGSGLTDNAATTTFTSVIAGSTGTTKTYTITNLVSSSGNLTGINVILTGAGATNFTLDKTGLATSLPPGASTTFTVAFSPLSTGSKTCGLEIASNDTDENPFNITLAGTGVATTVTLSSTGSAQTVTIPDGVGSFTVEAWGGGGSGSGGSGSPSNNGGGGGGGGAYARKVINGPLAPTYSVFVGAAGQDSTLNTNVVVAKAGSAGTNASAGVGGSATASVGDVKRKGGDGGYTSAYNSGAGGGSSASPSADGNAGQNATNNGTPGTGGAGWGTGTPAEGSGGGGGGNSSAGAAGTLPGGGGGGGGRMVTTTGAGAAGRVVLTFAASFPEIDVQGNGQSIVDGDITPDLADHTSFGDVLLGGSATRTYTIANLGTAPLTLGTVGVTGSGFSVASQPIPPVAPGGSTTFGITFTPAATGVSSGTVSFSHNDTDENPYNFSVQGNGIVIPIIVTNPSFSLGTAGQAFSETFTQTNAVGTATFTTASTLPNGLTLSTAGVLSGTPLQTGIFPIVVTCTDSNGTVGTGSIYNLTIFCQSISVGVPSNANGTAGMSFSETFTEAGAIGGATFTTASTLPTGVSLSTGGTLSGIPLTIGTYPVVVTVTDGNSCTGVSFTYNLSIGCQVITVNNPLNASGTVNASFSESFTQMGAEGTATFTTASILPSGITLATNGVLSGIPTQDGSFPVVVTVADSNGCIGTGATYNLVIAPVYPEIAVFDGNGTGGTERTDNSGTHDFGSVNTSSSSAAQTFTIQNTGMASLMGLAVSSTNPTEFGFTQPMTESLAPGATTTFTVTFSPSAAGTRSGLISISSNDSDENPFRINVSGTGLALNTAPVITSYSGGVNVPISLNENSLGIYATVTATDVDVPAQTLTYSLGGPDAALFHLTPGGQLMSRTALDFEMPTDQGANNVYEVTITVTDNGSPNLSTVQNFAFTILNVNDAPTLTAIPDQTLAVGGSTGPLAFTIGDTEPTPVITVLSPVGIAGTQRAGSASFGPSVFNVTADLVIANPAQATGPLTNAAACVGKIVIVDRGLNSFVMKAAFVQAAGAVGMIVVNNVSNQVAPAMGGTDPSITIPTLSMSLEDGAVLKASVLSGPVIATLDSNGEPALRLTVTATSSNTTLVPNANIVLGGTGAARTVAVTPAAGQSGLTVITVTVSDGTLTSSREFLVFVGGPAPYTVFTETFEDAADGYDVNGWNHTPLTGSPDWVWSTARSHSATHSWYAQSGINNARRALLSPLISVTSTSQISFYHTYAFEIQPGLEYDGGTLEYSADGMTWSTVPDAAFVSGGFNGTVAQNFATGNVLKGKRAWVGGTAGALTQVVVNLASFANGQIIRLRWHAGDDQSTVEEGWYVDEVVLTGASPEIAVYDGNGTGGAQRTDNTGIFGFGSVNSGSSSAAQTFTIQNAGGSNLTLGIVTLGGTDPGHFSVTQPDSSTLAPGATTTFTVTFSPTSIGTKSAVVNIASNDGDETPFEISVDGAGVSPEIVVYDGSGTGGSQRTDNTGTHDFGSVDSGTSSAAQTFTVQNTGGSNLTLGTVTLGGADPGQFSVTQPASSTLAPNATTTFTVTFSPITTGTKNAVVNIASNDADENPFEIQVQGTGTTTLVSRVYALDLRTTPNRLIQFPPNSPASFTLISANIANDYYALDFTPDSSKLYGVTSTGELHEINPSNGAVVSSVPLAGIPGGHIVSGLTFMPNGTVYVSTSMSGASTLHTLSVTSGQLTLVGSMGTGLVIEISASPSGQMVGHDIQTDSFYFVNPSTGALTLIGAHGLAANFAQGMDFDGLTGVLYAAVYTGGGAVTYGSVSLATGAVTAIPGLPSGEYEMAIAGGPASAPEIAVEDHLNTNLTDNDTFYRVPFGTTDVGTSITRNFTIKNTGNAALSIGAITFDGAEASDFAVTTAPPSSIAAGSQATFAVTFTAKGDGGRSATMHIVNGDSNETPFDIRIRGVGTNTTGGTWTGSPALVDLPPDGSFYADGLNFGTDLGFVPTPEQKYTFINIQGALPARVVGHFNDLPDGGVVAMSFNGVIYYFQADYEGGTGGNDLVLTNFTPESSPMWKWVSGPSSRNGVGIYGEQHEASETNNPGARQGAMNWLGANGNLWLFGGYGYGTALTNPPRWLNDLWEFDRASGQWIWHTGSTTHSVDSTYGDMGSSDPANTPGSRHTGSTWTDSSGSLWLYGGFSKGSWNSDLWRYRPDTGEWTWMNGANTPNAAPVRGTLGVADPANTPGARSSATTWFVPGAPDPIDFVPGGKLYLFGGYNGTTYYNDLWSYDLLTEQWTWLGGGSAPNQNGVYGTQGVAAPANLPGSRRDATAFVGHDGSLYLFGGLGYDAGSPSRGDLNDLWKFDPAAGQNGLWTWVNGSNATGAAGSYGTLNAPAAGNSPPARSAGSGWATVDGKLWLVGGFKNSNHSYNDVWIFDPGTGLWTWKQGASGAVWANGVYGEQGVAAAGNQPGARFTPSTWVTLNGTLWVFGGGGADAFGNTGRMSDLWSYGIPNRDGAPLDNFTPAPFPDEFIVNASPNAYSATAGTEAYVPVSGQLAGTDADGDKIIFSSTSATTVSQGTLTLNADGTWTYTPAFGFTGVAAFQFRASDNYGGRSAVKTLVITVITNPADSDGDGLADAFERSMWGDLASADGDGDADFDGQSNYFEFLAGTNPLSGSETLSTAPSIAGTASASGGIQLQLNHVRPGVYYHLETSSNLEQWSRAGTFTFDVAGSATIEDPTPSTGAPKFYRMSLEATSAVILP